LGWKARKVKEWNDGMEATQAVCLKMGVLSICKALLVESGYPKRSPDEADV